MYKIAKEYKKQPSFIFSLITSVFYTRLLEGDKHEDIVDDLVNTVKDTGNVEDFTQKMLDKYQPEEISEEELDKILRDQLKELSGIKEAPLYKDIPDGELALTGNVQSFLKTIDSLDDYIYAKTMMYKSLEGIIERTVQLTRENIINETVIIDLRKQTIKKPTEEDLQQEFLRNLGLG